MTFNSSKISTILLLSFIIIGCNEEITPANEPERVGFELLEIKSFSEIIVWINDESMTQEEFDTLEIPSNWRKNEPRESDPDSAFFYRSPDAERDGDFTTQTHFGYQWLFNAQVVATNVPLPGNEDGLLIGNSIAKYHQVKFNAGKTLYILISPEGDEFVRISRDANRIIEIPMIPETWKLEERVLSEDLVFDLPNPTLNIRAQNNQDSFQGLCGLSCELYFSGLPL